ncbi:hypothetical protein BCR42DRAFT_332573, partial [Absidia repens]
HFPPLLVLNLDRNVILRWANVECDGTMNKRPDATISTVRQLEFDKSLGFGEAKPSGSTCNKFALCHDLLRLAVFCKDTLDINQLKASLSFQIHGFQITFFLTRLRHDGLYIKQEIGNLTFPRSVDELPTFINMKIMRILLQVTDVFWRFCKKDEQWLTPWSRLGLAISPPRSGHCPDSPDIGLGHRSIIFYI